MTGAAEEAREVLPDPNQPAIINGDFSQLIDGTDLPIGWHYLRGAKVVGSENYLSFENTEPGKASRALQGMAIEGRTIAQLKLSARVRGRDLKQGATPKQRATILITFYDHRRAVIGNERLGNWQGTFPWQTETRTVRVPLATREAIVRLGLLGGVGQFDVDDLVVEAVPL